jgi:hypothetical protein
MGTKRFAISFRDLDTISTRLATLLGGGPDRSRVEVDPEEIRVRAHCQRDRCCLLPFPVR